MNYADWIYRSVWRGFGDTFLIPYSEKFWGVHPRTMSFEWTENRIPKADVWKVLRGGVVSQNTRVGTNAVFRYPKDPHGYGAVPNAIRNAIGERLRLGKRAMRIDTERRQIIFNDCETIDYSILLSTIPLPTFARIATAVPANVHEAVEVLHTNSIMVVNLGVARANITSKHWIHFPEKDIVFFRITFPHNLCADLTPSGVSAISCEVSYPTGNPPDCRVLVRRVREDLVRVGVLRPDDEIVVSHTRDIPFGYCIYDDARRDALRVVFRWLDSVDIVPGGRYGL